MIYFTVIGTLENLKNMNDSIMEEHKAYTQKAMDEGMILLSGLKTDQSGGMFIIKAESVEQLEAYVYNEPFYVQGIQTYTYQAFDVHYINAEPNDWLKK